MNSHYETLNVQSMEQTIYRMLFGDQKKINLFQMILKMSILVEGMLVR